MKPGILVVSELWPRSAATVLPYDKKGVVQFGHHLATARHHPRAPPRAGLSPPAVACTLGAVPPCMLLIMDEPTNHLDPDGIAALEATLRAYDGSVLAVSHDKIFIRSLAPDRTIHLGE